MGESQFSPVFEGFSLNRIVEPVIAEIWLIKLSVQFHILE